MTVMRWVVLLGLLALTAGCGQGTPEQPSAPVAKGHIPWVTDPAAGFKQAKESGKPIMMDVMASWCSACKRLEAEVWSRQDVAGVAKSYVTVQADGDKYPEIPKKYSVSGYPTTIFLTPEGKEIARVRGAAPYQDMLAAMQEALKKAPKAG
jgi:thiol:disulfide interchange protein